MVIKIIAIHTVQFTIYRINKDIFIIFLGLKIKTQARYSSSSWTFSIMPVAVSDANLIKPDSNARAPT